MSTFPFSASDWSHIPASKVLLGSIYKTRVEAGEVFAKVVEIVPPTPKTRNKTFRMVDIVTQLPLPKPKRAEDLAPLAYPSRGWHEFGGGNDRDRAWGP